MSFSTRIISTDVPLLFFWAVALLAYLQAPARAGLALGRRCWASSLGFGLLAKYAMIYFVLGAIVRRACSTAMRARC